MPAVRTESKRRHTRRLMLFLSGAMAVSGLALTVGAVGSSLLFKRGSMRASFFVAITVLLVTIAAGRDVCPAIVRYFSALHPHETDSHYAWRLMGRPQKVR
jgi:hypothetical protein